MAKLNKPERTTSLSFKEALKKALNTPLPKKLDNPQSALKKKTDKKKK